MVSPFAFYTTANPTPIQYPTVAQQLSPASALGPPPGFGLAPAQVTGPAHYITPAQTHVTGLVPFVSPTSPMGYHVIPHAQPGPTQAVAYPVAPTAPQVNPGSIGTQETTLPHAFTTVTLRDFSNGAWNMDTVGDGHSIPVTNTGHSILPTPFKFLHLNNVTQASNNAGQARKETDLLKVEPKKVIHALKDPSWIEAMQEELLQFKNKKDERGIVIRNKESLVAQGYTQEEWIDYDEVFAPVARIKAIRLFLAYASFKDFMVYQMDVKSAFLYGKIKEEVYMSSMDELTFFLGLQVKQKKDDIFISQDKYVEEILKKFKFTEVKTASTPMETQKPLLKDEDDEEVDVYMYWSMIGSMMYLTSSRSDIMFAVCVCDRYQANLKVSNLYAMKSIFRYLKGQPKLGLWYPKDSPLDLVAYTDSDYARANLDRKSIIGGCQFIGCRLILWQCKKQTVVANSTTEAEYVAALSCCGQVLGFKINYLIMGRNKSVKLMMEKLELILVKTINGEAQLHALVDDKKIIVTESSIRRDPQLADEEGADCLPNSTIFEQLTLMGPKTTAWNEFSSTMASVIIFLATNQKFNLLKFIFDSMIRNMDNLSGKFLMYPRVGKGFSGRVTPLFQTMVVQNQSQLVEGSTIPTDPHQTPTFIQPSTQPKKTQQPKKPKIKDTRVPQPSDPIENVADEAVHKDLGDSLVRVATTASSLEAEQDSGNINKTQSKAKHNESSSLGTTSGGGPMCQETMGDTLAQTRFENVSTHSNDSLLARVSTAGDATTVSAATTTTATIKTVDDITLAQALMEIKSIKPKEKGDKCKGILIELVKPIKKKDLIRLDEEDALKLQAEFDEEERLAREKAKKEKKSQIALIKTWDDIHAKIDVDHQLAEILQAQEQEELFVEEKATLFQQLLEKRRKHFSAKRAEEKRNKPPTKTQQRKIIVGGRQRKKSRNRADTRECKEVKDEEEVTIDAIPLAVKSPSIVGWKIYKEGRKSYYQIMRADGKSQTYMIFSQMLKSSDMQDLEDLYKLVKAKYESARLVEDLDLLLWGDLKTMFEPHVEDNMIDYALWEVIENGATLPKTKFVEGVMTEMPITNAEEKA
ncbi:uncharacterized mitochondrial protein-like protein [Tanacetum coccineum]